MADDIQEVLVSANRGFPNPFTILFPRRTQIENIDVDATIREEYTDTTVITRHPVQVGAAITDHAFNEPPTLVLTCGWSNTSFNALAGTARAVAREVSRAPDIASAARSVFAGGSMAASDYVSDVYSRLLKLKDARVPFTVSTGLRLYDNMLIENLSVTRDAQTAQALMVTATLRSILIAHTQTVSLPPKNLHAFPQVTAEAENRGIQQVKEATPSPGGAFPIGGR